MTPKPRGLAALALTDPDRAREIQSKGGKAKKARHYDDPEAALRAGIKGNQAQGKIVVDAPVTLSNKDT
jgi:general stress protein YciG